ncbi:MAG TPA: hypothetical protein VJ323_07960 [Bryobacteraceae bacterium]|jgi:hypothetical protein|nr:hypothetical protein [Bryobacteraceae bacterium]
MFQWVKGLFKRRQPDGPRHISTFKKADADNLVKFRFRVTGKLVWTQPVREERLDRLANETLGPGKIVAYGDVTYRPITDTAFVAYFRDYYTNKG